MTSIFPNIKYNLFLHKNVLQQFLNPISLKYFLHKKKIKIKNIKFLGIILSF